MVQFDGGELVRHLFDFSEGSFSGYELSVFFALFVFLQFWNMFNAKAYASSRSAFFQLNKCKNFLFILLLIIVGQIAITTFGGDMFRVVPLDLLTWAIIIGVTSVVLWIGELFRLFSFSKK